jgi:hypothetical protein
MAIERVVLDNGRHSDLVVVAQTPIRQRITRDRDLFHSFRVRDVRRWPQIGLVSLERSICDAVTIRESYGCQETSFSVASVSGHPCR